MIQMVIEGTPFQVRNTAGKEEILDPVRRQWVKLTPEEWVRQNLLHWFTQTLNYPMALISVEKALIVGEMRKRYDIVVYNPSHQPWMLVECKRPEVELSEQTLLQVMRYNMKMKTKYLLVSNGHATFAADIQGLPAQWLEQMPIYPAIV